MYHWVSWRGTTTSLSHNKGNESDFTHSCINQRLNWPQQSNSHIISEVMIKNQCSDLIDALQNCYGFHTLIEIGIKMKSHSSPYETMAYCKEKIIQKSTPTVAACYRIPSIFFWSFLQQLIAEFGYKTVLINSITLLHSQTSYMI